jgi:hypothetical protein
MIHFPLTAFMVEQLEQAVMQDEITMMITPI